MLHGITGREPATPALPQRPFGLRPVLADARKCAIYRENNAMGRCSSTVEHLICNQVVASSILAIGLVGTIALGGEVPEWPKGADCKSAGLCLRRFESSPLHQYSDEFDGESGNSSVGRARAFQARGRGFESRFPLQKKPSGDGSERRQFFWRTDFCFLERRLFRLSRARMPM